MSRSYKKNPGWKASCRRSTKIDKRHASKSVRRAPFVDDGSAYKRFFNSWNIYDYNFRAHSHGDAINQWSIYYGHKIYKAWIK